MTVYPKQNGCEECIVYKIHHNQSEPELCPECGHKSLYWTLHHSGALLVRCSRCYNLALVETNTICEADPIYYETPKIVIEPQSYKPDNQTILRMAKYLNISGLKMREMVINGCVLAQSENMIDEVRKILDDNNIEYRFIEPEDPREKYPYYKQCNYIYSGMKRYLPEACHEQSKKNKTKEKEYQKELLSKEEIYKKLCEFIPENKEMCEQYISEFDLDEYPFAFSCIYMPMMEAYKQGSMKLFQKYSELIELVMDQGEELIAMAVGDEVLERLEFDESSDVWETFRNNVSPGFNY